jgi:hypothetical protein
MNTIKQRIFTNWHLMRLIRLGLSVWLVIMAVQEKDILMGAVGAFFLYTAIAGVGCCGPSGCYTTQNNDSGEDLKDTEYEEIK